MKKTTPRKITQKKGQKANPKIKSILIVRKYFNSENFLTSGKIDYIVL